MSRPALSIPQVILVLVVVAFFAVLAGATTGWFLGRHVLNAQLVKRLGMSPDALLMRLKEVEGEYQALYAHCEPLEGSERDMLIQAQERVEGLRGEIEEKQAEIAVLEKKAQENVALKKDLEKRKQELAQLQSALVAAEQERTELVEKLQLAVEEVSVARAEAREAKSETLVVKWDEFRANAMLQICERGSRGKIEKCRETVEAAFHYDRERRYRECVRQGNAVPQLRELGKDEKELPAYAEWVDANDRATKGWYILFCDPTLPEAGDAAHERAVLEAGESDPVEAQGRDDVFIEGLDD
jgi:predicted  nucleic acid-binding Zn-ribbon protein